MEISAVYDELKDDVLLISEPKNKVVLPFSVEKLNRQLESEKCAYKTLQELIDGEYTIPLDKFKVGFISRFKEGYALMRKKEKSSFWDAADLAFELMGIGYLHPAIISACKNLDELDIYLDCLFSNELDDFPFFEIKYELLPKKQKINKKNIKTGVTE